MFRIKNRVPFRALVVLIVSLLTGCSEKEASPYPKTVTIEYSVTSPDVKMMNVSYTDELGNTKLESSVVLPFSKKLTRKVEYLDGAMIDLLVNNGSVTAKIYVDGVVVEDQTCAGNSTSIVMCKVPHIFM